MRSLILMLLLPFLVSCFGNDKTIQVLILSGRNNHDWSATTQQIKMIFSGSDRFSCSVTLQPDTLSPADLKSFDVVLSNWNSWPENEFRWPEETENVLSEFIHKGGGFVTFHASTSALYEWPEFKKFTTAAWIMNQTKHGKNSATEVSIVNSNHPVTKGMSGFYIFDELWVNAEENADFEVLGTATNKELKAEGTSAQPAIMVSKYGRGRIFHTILGHDLRAMRNTGFKELLLRGIEWAATGKVTLPIVQELKQPEQNAKYNWIETDTTLTLFKGENIVWQYNYNTKHGRPFFHPVFVNRNNMTCISPEDHRWHLGQWFCWKYINKVNYWEYGRGPFQSDGVTEVKNVKIKKNDDFTAEIELDIVYHPFGGENVLAEKRLVRVGPPQQDGKLTMDYDFSFEALANEVELNRTPILGQEGGTSWGGYAGISIRFNQSFMDSEFISSWGENDSVNGKKGDWLYMEFTGLDGSKVGSQIIIHPDSHTEGEAWYSVNTEELPFYYFSTAVLYYEPLILSKGEKLHLQYRINHFTGEMNRDELENENQNYLNN